jgi:hypothetical protein
LTFLITGKIIFERSNGSKTYYPDIWDHGEYFDPQPCTPRSLYKAAHSKWFDATDPENSCNKFSGYGIERLQPICLDEIMKEITPKNVLKELYSEYSSTYSALYARQEKYLVDNFVSPCLRYQWDNVNSHEFL